MQPSRVPPEPTCAELAHDAYQQMTEVLEKLDQLGMFPAGAHLAMAMDAVRRRLEMRDGQADQSLRKP